MAGRNSEPIELILAKGDSHKTKAEINERLKTEVKPITDHIEPPKILTTKKQKQLFDIYAEQLMKQGTFGEGDCDTLARYIIACEQYEHCSRQLRKKAVKDDFEQYKYYARQQDIFFKQCEKTGAVLGMGSVNRCKLSVPKKEEPQKVNRFAKFGIDRASGDTE